MKNISEGDTTFLLLTKQVHINYNSFFKERGNKRELRGKWQ